MKRLFVTGTDTDVGKTVVSAGLCMVWNAHYWKPIQAGYGDSVSNEVKLPSAILPQTDNETLSRFIPQDRIHPSAYNLKNPMSPNQAARRENITIKMKDIRIPPDVSAPWIIEGAGGCLVPINDQEDMTDLMRKMDCPVVLVSRSGLGTLNHTFLSLAYLRSKKIPVWGVIMVGSFHKENKKDIEQRGKAPVLLELPFLDSISASSLRPYFENIKL